ncbi:MAG: hypothetical protein PWP41_1865 [Moorella sp. (in: firmicutes)]|nr:hypothetical protein [Moorella sp. (in: firmicutes)]
MIGKTVIQQRVIELERRHHIGWQVASPISSPHYIVPGVQKLFPIPDLKVDDYCTHGDGFLAHRTE